MSGRRSTAFIRCAQDGCPERRLFEYDSQRERLEHARQLKDRPWRCTRHTQPDEVLSPANDERATVLTASRHPRAPGLYWLEDGKTTAGSGFVHGPGFKAFADDFAEGTRLTVTARIDGPPA